MTLMRSAAKPAQALAILETGCFEQYGFNDADLALMCSSHSSEDRHIERARSMLARTGATEEDMCCEGDHALADAVNRAWIKNDFAPTATCNNCSGKNDGQACWDARWCTCTNRAKIEDYHPPDHPMQVRVKQAVEDLCKSKATTAWALHECHLPAPEMPGLFIIEGRI